MVTSRFPRVGEAVDEVALMVAELRLLLRNGRADRDRLEVGLERGIAHAGGGQQVADPRLREGKIGLPYQLVWLARRQRLQDRDALAIVGERLVALPDDRQRVRELC